MKIKAGEKMRKIWIALFFISCLSFTNCMSNSTNSFENMAIQIEGSEKDDLLRVTISGFNPTSMIFIKDYHIEYDGNKVFIKINETQKDAGIAMDYCIQFLMRKSANEIYLDDRLLWTNSVESYFKNQGLKFPLDVNSTVNRNNISINLNKNPAQTGLSKEEAEKIDDFIKHFSKEISFEKCKKWKEDAVAFSISNFGIFEDGGKKHLCISVNAYSEAAENHDRIKKIKNTDISVLHNILLFDYDTYKELGWVF